jgi:hypothetical protein
MKKVVRILALSALLVAAVQAATPKPHDIQIAGGGPVPLCWPGDPCDTGRIP